MKINTIYKSSDNGVHCYKGKINTGEKECLKVYLLGSSAKHIIVIKKSYKITSIVQSLDEVGVALASLLQNYDCYLINFSNVNIGYLLNKIYDFEKESTNNIQK